MTPTSTSHAPLALLAGATFFAGAADAANLVTNGSFETGTAGVANPTDVTGWTGIGRLYNHPYNGIAGIKLADAAGAQSTPATGNFDFNSLTYGYNDDVTLGIGSKFHGLGGGTQIIPEAALTTVVTPAELDSGAAVFAFSGWLTSYTGDNNIPALRLRFFSGDNGTGTVLGTEHRLDRGLSANQVTTAQFLATGDFFNGTEDSRTDRDYWALYEIKSGVPAGARSAVIDFVAGTGHVAGGSNDWYVDGIVLDVVPVPSLRWTGAASSEWSTAVIGAPKNWELSASPGSGVDFTPLSPVLFGESGARTVSINGADVLPASAIFDHASGNYEITGTHGIAGTTGVIVNGGGTLTLSNPNSFSGATQVSSGALVIGHELALQGSTLAGVFGSGTHTFGNITAATLGGLGGDADLLLSNPSLTPVALTVGANGGNAVHLGEITGAGSITKTGAGQQTLGFSNSYSGGTTTAAGILIAGSETGFGTGAVVSTGGIIEFAIAGGTESTVTNDFVLPGGSGALRMFASFGSGRSAPTPGTAVRLTGKISGGDPARQFYISDTGIGLEHDNTTILDNAANDFAGTVFINRATVAFTSDGALGDTENDITHFSENLNGKLRFDAADITLNPLRALDLPGAANVRPIDTQDFTGTIAGPISGTGTLVKQGTGTLVLSSTASTFTGAVDVAAGTLRMDGQFAPSAAAVTVPAGGTLTGGGTLPRAVSLNGGTLAPGTGTGALLGVTALTLGASSSYAFDLADWTGAAGSGHDTLAVDSLAITATDLAPVTIVVNPQTLANFTDTAESFTLVSTSGGITGFTPEAFVVDASALPAATSLTWSVQVLGNDLVLSYAAAGSAFESWIASKGLTGNDALFDADPDFDGIRNGLEFVLGGEPNPALPGANSAALLPTAVRNGSGDLVFTFRRADDAAGLNPGVEYDVDLAGTWTPAQGGVDGVTVSETENGFGPGIDRVEVTLPAALASGGRLFARLAVSE
jgi:autotransporter-associated beta strand protein